VFLNIHGAREFCERAAETSPLIDIIIEQIGKEIHAKDFACYKPAGISAISPVQAMIGLHGVLRYNLYESICTPDNEKRDINQSRRSEAF